MLWRKALVMPMYSQKSFWKQNISAKVLTLREIGREAWWDLFLKQNKICALSVIPIVLDSLQKIMSTMCKNTNSLAGSYRFHTRLFGQ
jgi:hypothetical protein